jgi:hypothetical protein
MEFMAETIRLTPIDTQRHLIGRGPVVLSGMTIDIATERQTLAEVVAKYGSIKPEGHPAEWQHVEVVLSRINESNMGMTPWDVQAVLVAATRSSAVALEAWGAGPDSGRYLVVPWIDIEGLGACVCVDRTITPSRVEFGGDLFDDLWGLDTEEWYEPRECDGLERPFLPLIPPEVGELWVIADTDTPPPPTTERGDWTAMVAADPFRLAS